MNRLLILCILASISSMICAQNMISGHIVDKDKLPILGATVYIKSLNIGASTNANGYFKIQEVSDGKYDLVISSIGYTTQKVVAETGSNTEINIQLDESISKLNEVVVMSGGNSGIKEIAGSAQYISPKDLEKFNYTDINRALRTVPGVNIQEEDGFGLRPNIGMRATGVERSSKITLMEDGILMAPAPYVAPAAYYFPTMGRMQGIEVMKGSSQIKYGPFTTGGALNLISTQIPDQVSGKVNLMFGSFGTNSLHVHVGNSGKRIGFLLETFQLESDGFKEIDGGGNTGFNRSDYIGKIRFNTSEKAKIYQSLTLKIGTVDETANETYLGLTESDFDDNPNRRYYASQKDVINSEQWQLSLSHEVRFSKNMTLVTTAYRNEFKRNWYKLDKIQDSSGAKSSISDILDNPTEYERAFKIINGSSTMNDEVLLVKANNRSYYAQGIQTELNQSFSTGSIKHKLTLGMRLHQDQIDRFQWIDDYKMENGVMMLSKAGEEGTESNRIERADALATYIQYQIKIDRMTIIPGIRHEHISLKKKDFGKNDPNRLGNDLKEYENRVDVFLPGIGLNYNFNEFYSLFAGYHKGFAPPGTKEGTLPEMSDNFELGTRYIKNSINLQTTLFYNDYSNLLGADLNASGGTGSNDLYNGGKAEAMGLEFQLNMNLLSHNKYTSLSMPIQISYTYTEAHFRSSFDSEFEGWGSVEDGDELPYLAPHQIGIMLGLTYQKASLNISGRYTAAMRTEPGQGSIPKNESTDDYFAIDISFNYSLTREISLFSSISNLTNETYIVSRRPAGLRPGLPRSINAGIKTVF